eukprot:9670389-Heterocapsa_arctica.AAC.1
MITEIYNAQELQEAHDVLDRAPRLHDGLSNDRGVRGVPADRRSRVEMRALRSCWEPAAQHHAFTRLRPRTR